MKRTAILLLPLLLLALWTLPASAQEPKKKERWHPKFREVADGQFWRKVLLNTATGAFNIWAAQRAVNRNPEAAETVPSFGKRPSLKTRIVVTVIVHAGITAAVYEYKSLEMRQKHDGLGNDGLPSWQYLPHILDAAHIAFGINDLRLVHRRACPSGTVCQ